MGYIPSTSTQRHSYPSVHIAKQRGSGDNRNEIDEGPYAEGMRDPIMSPNQAKAEEEKTA